MGYQVLARKWRPGKFSELVGQEHVVRAISNALDNNRLHHAYLFTGTRGVGKTTIARIFSRSLNCEQGVSSNPCGICPACLDIEKGSYVDLIEIDAASRTKVEDTREILDNVQYRPTRGEYKVYLIDEVHMLSKHSFNALLKTLEEPPPHVKFLLATTDPQKLPITILSRCLQFNLKALTREQIGGQLSYILKAENIAFESKALELLARSAHGSMRDALSLTDQAIAQGNGQVMSDVVSEMLGLIDADQITRLVSAILEKDKVRVLDISSELALMGTDFKAALAELMSVFHQIALTQFVPEACKLETSQARQIYAWARAVNPESVQLYYQIALQGRKDIEWAQDFKVGFEMALMRMMAFTPEAITTDITDLQVAAKEANQANLERIPAPPRRLLMEPASDNELVLATTKKNESEPESKRQLNVDSRQPNPEEASQVETAIDGSAVDKMHQSAQPEEAEAKGQTLSAEMLSLMQEADELRAEQPGGELSHSEQIIPEEPDAEPEVRPAAPKIASQASMYKTATPDDESSHHQHESSFALRQDSSSAIEPLNTELQQERPSDTPVDGHNQAVQSKISPSEFPAQEADAVDTRNTWPQEEPPAHEYADGNLLQQSDSEGTPPMAESAPASANRIEANHQREETDDSAHTASLLSLMQTLNQASAEENKTPGGETANVNVNKRAEENKPAGLFEKLPARSEQPDSEPGPEVGVPNQTTPPLQSSTFNYSDDLYQTGTYQPESVNDDAGLRKHPQPEQDPDTEEAFFSAQNFLNQQEDAVQGYRGEPQPQSDHLSSAEIFEMPEHMPSEPFVPEAQSYQHGHELVSEHSVSLKEDVAPEFHSHGEITDFYSQESAAQTQVQLEQSPEEEYQATDTEMSVDFEIPFAIDGKKVTKASQLDTWSQLIERAGLGGLTKQLALNSNYFKSGENIKLVVSETQKHLLSENTLRTIEESISDAIQQTIKVDANIGEVIDTPAAVQKAINNMRQQHAVKTINEDSAVADICHSFSGTILQDTIKPR